MKVPREKVMIEATKVTRRMVGPRERGEQARRALLLLPDEVTLAIASYADRNVETDARKPAAFLAETKGVLRRPEIREWCGQVEAESEGRLASEDAAAAVTSAYVAEAMTRGSLGERYQREVAAMLVPVLRGAVRMTRLNALKRQLPPEQDEKGPPVPVPARRRETPLWEGLYVPLSELWLLSVARLRLVLEAVGARKAIDRPFGWCPSSDSIWRSFRHGLLGQVNPSRFLPDGLVYSVFGRHAIQSGLAAIVRFRAAYCTGCGRDLLRLGQNVCPGCDGELKARTRLRLVGVNFLAACAVSFDSKGPYYSPPDPRLATGPGNGRPRGGKEAEDVYHG